MKKIKQIIDINTLELIKKTQFSTSKECIEIINLIDSFITDIKENSATKFDFGTFLDWLLQLNLKDIEIIYAKFRYLLINFLKHMILDIKFDKNLFFY